MKLIRLWTVSIAAAIISFSLLPVVVQTVLAPLDPASENIILSTFGRGVHTFLPEILTVATWIGPAAFAWFALRETVRRVARAALA